MAKKGKYVWDAEKGAWVLGPEQEETVEAVGEIEEHELTREDSDEEIVAADEYGDEDDTAEHAGVEESTNEDIVEANIDDTVSSYEDDVLESEIQEEGPRYKGFIIRIIAYFVDIMLISIVCTAIGYAVAGKPISVVISPEEPENFLPAWLYLIGSGVYFIGMWTWRGRTLGMRLIKAKIIRTDGSDIGFLGAVIRWIFWITPVWSFSPMAYASNYIWVPLYLILLLFVFIIPFNRKKRGIQDFIAGTYVVDSRPAEILLEDDDEYYDEDAVEEAIEEVVYSTEDDSDSDN